MLTAVLTLILACLLTTQTRAQQVLIFGNNALPSCAQQCTALTQAQAACVPPAAPVTGQATYESCFCQSGYLTSLTNSPETVCSTVCSASELTQIATWYSNNCQDGGAAAASSEAASSASANVSTMTTAATASNGPPSSLSSSSEASVQQTADQEQGWWALHRKWVVMVISIFVGLGILALVATLLRRRHLRRQDTMKGRFNDGITTRSTANTNDLAMAQTSNCNNGRQTPGLLRGFDAGGDSRLGTPGKLARVREVDMGMEELEHDSPPVDDDTRHGYLGKGKMKAQVTNADN